MVDPKISSGTKKAMLKFFGSGTIIMILGFLLAYQFVDPAPPRRIVIATGISEGAYYHFGKAYQKILARDGVTLEVRQTEGSVENLKLLSSGTVDVDLAFFQGGTGFAGKSAGLVSLGSLYFEPLFIFQRRGLNLKRLYDLKGMRLAVGPEGSGTRVLALQLLDANGVGPRNAEFMAVGGEKAAAMVEGGDVDVAFFVTGQRTDYLRNLLISGAAVPISLDRAAAYTRRFNFLSVLTVPEGAVDFAANIPAKDITLVAPTAQLVARPALHPALIELLLQAAKEVHSQGIVFERRGQFPSPEYVEFDLSHDAARFYESGVPFLRRYLPFWVANFLIRMKVMLLPLVALLFPFFKVMPSLYRWRIRSKIYRWYAELQVVDQELFEGSACKTLAAYQAELDQVEHSVSKLHVPLSYSEELYHLRLHIEMLRNRLIRTEGSLCAPSAPKDRSAPPSAS